MSARLSRRIVRIAVAVIADPALRERYREQWLADVEGAAEVGLAPLPVALGAASAAIRLGASRRSLTPMVSGVSDRVRRAYGAMLLLTAAPYLWAAGYYGYARIRLGVSHAALVSGNHDPKDLVVWWAPVFWPYVPTALWINVAGWAVAACFAPFGLILGLTGRGAGRWMPLAGSAAAAAAVAIGTSDLGHDLQTWFLD
jgi:hypothetical protein